MGRCADDLVRFAVTSSGLTSPTDGVLRRRALSEVVRLCLARLELLDGSAEERCRPDRARVAYCLTALLATDGPAELEGWVAGLLDHVCAWLWQFLAVGDRLDVTDAAVGFYLRCLELGLDHGGDLAARDAMRHALAWAQWYRFLAERGDPAEAALFAAVEHFEQLYQAGRSVVPPQIRAHLDRMVIRRDSLRKRDLPYTEPPSLGAVGREILRSRAALEHCAMAGDRVAPLTRLVVGLTVRYAIAGHREDIDEALEAVQQLAGVTGVAHVDVGLLCAAADASAQAYYTYAESTESVPHARAAILLAEAVLEVCAEEPDTAAVFLVAASRLAAQQTGDVDLLDRTLQVLQQALTSAQRRTTPGAVLIPMVHAERYAVTGADPDYHSAVASVENALKGREVDEEAFDELNLQLAELRRQRWGNHRELDDLDIAIAILRRRVRRAVDRDGDAAVLELRAKLASWLHERHLVTHHPDDSREAATLLIAVAAQGVVDPPLLSSSITLALGNGLVDDHLVADALEILTQLAREEDPVGEPTAARRWANLAQVLAHTDRDLDAAHVERILEAAANALALADDSDGETRAIALIARTKAAVEREDWASAQEAVQAALALPVLPALHAEALRISLIVHLAADRDGPDGIDILRFVDAARAIVDDPNLPPVVRRQAAYLWCHTTVGAGDHAGASAAYGHLLDLQRDAIWEASGPRERRQALAEHAQAVEDGAACALVADLPGVALMLWESHRDVEGRRMRDRRRSIAAIKAASPGDGQRIDRLVHALGALDKLENAERFWDYLEAVAGAGLPLIEEASAEIFHPSNRILEGGLEAAEEAVRRFNAEVIDHSNELRSRFHRELATIADRAQPGTAVQAWSDERLADVRAAVTGGVAVVVNASHLGCHAVIVTSSATTVLPLPAMTGPDAVRQVGALYEQILDWQNPESATDHAAAEEALAQCQAWLWRVAVRPILDAAALRPASDDALPRIWWCLVGVLGYLPFHAAEGRDGIGVTDVCVSSYVTTLTSLVDDAGEVRSAGQGTAAVLSNHDGGPGAALPAARREVDEVARLLAAHGVDVRRGASDLNQVADDVRRARWLHAACHGQPGVGEKAPAGLATTAGFLSAARLRWMEGGGSGGAVAFLSSCHSASFASATMNEPDHLAAAMQACGFRHVVATLWEVGDRTAAAAATAFYRGLAVDSHLDPDRAARALHAYVRDVRRSRPRLLWVPFIHFGP